MPSGEVFEYAFVSQLRISITNGNQCKYEYLRVVFIICSIILNTEFTNKRVHTASATLSLLGTTSEKVGWLLIHSGTA